MARYTRSAAWYDQISAEQIYRVAREPAIRALQLAPGAKVLDVGCGTGLNFPLLLAAIARSGSLVGVDRSPDMLQVARTKSDDHPHVKLITADAQTLSRTVDPALATPFDAVLFTYTLSLMPDWRAAWHAATSLLRPGGRAAVVDMQRPRHRRWAPLARMATWAGGSTIDAHPWTLLEQNASDLDAWGFRDEHIQVRVGTP